MGMGRSGVSNDSRRCTFPSIYVWMKAILSGYLRQTLSLREAKSTVLSPIIRLEPGSGNSPGSA
jgi:hypothetical protein